MWLLAARYATCCALDPSTVQAAGLTFVFFGGHPGSFDLATTAKPLVGSAMIYYLSNMTYPVSALHGWNMAVGFGLIITGFIASMKWK